MGFCHSGTVQKWSGFTVQVNSSLKKSVPIGSIFKLVATIQRREGERKLWISARLINPFNEEVHCEGVGLFLLNKVKTAEEHEL
jgi:hypothetical protein